MAEGDDEFQRVLHDSDRGFGGVAFVLIRTN